MGALGAIVGIVTAGVVKVSAGGPLAAGGPDCPGGTERMSSTTAVAISSAAAAASEAPEMQTSQWMKEEMIQENCQVFLRDKFSLAGHKSET